MTCIAHNSIALLWFNPKSKYLFYFLPQVWKKPLQTKSCLSFFWLVFVRTPLFLFWFNPRTNISCVSNKFERSPLQTRMASSSPKKDRDHEHSKCKGKQKDLDTSMHLGSVDMAASLLKCVNPEHLLTCSEDGYSLMSSTKPNENEVGVSSSSCWYICLYFFFSFNNLHPFMFNSHVSLYGLYCYFGSQIIVSFHGLYWKNNIGTWWCGLIKWMEK